ncbi:unnamed protein product, partial [Prorocentrum cordatum]
IGAESTMALLAAGPAGVLVGPGAGNDLIGLRALRGGAQSIAAISFPRGLGGVFRVAGATVLLGRSARPVGGAAGLGLRRAIDPPENAMASGLLGAAIKLL